jgi:hypothetical protein
VHTIEITPQPCFVCGRGNTPDGDTHDRPTFVDLERDVNWNDAAVMCEDCITKAGSLIGMLTTDDAAAKDRELRKKDQEMHDLRVELDATKARATKAVRRARALEEISA